MIAFSCISFFLSFGIPGALRDAIFSHIFALRSLDIPIVYRRVYNVVAFFSAQEPEDRKERDKDRRDRDKEQSQDKGKEKDREKEKDVDKDEAFLKACQCTVDQSSAFSQKKFLFKFRKDSHLCLSDFYFVYFCRNFLHWFCGQTYFGFSILCIFVIHYILFNRLCAHIYFEFFRPKMPDFWQLACW